MSVALLRVALVVVAFLNIGGMISIGLVHWRAWRLLPAGAGLLPLHVFLVALAVSGLQGTLTWAQLTALSDDTPPVDGAAIARIILYFLFSALLTAALGVMANLQYRRVTVNKEPKEVVATSEKTVARIRIDGDTGHMDLEATPHES